MAPKHKPSITKRRKSIVLEKLSDSSNNNSNDKDSENSIKTTTKMKSKNLIQNSLNNHNENVSQRKFFPRKNIFELKLFVDNIENINRYKCGLCECICEEPKFQNCRCNQVFCAKCLYLYYEIFHHRCPKCQKEAKEIEPYPGFFELLRNLKMKCINYDKNCHWIGFYKEYKEHINSECQKEIINCPNKDCIIKTRREEMKNHLQKCEYREITCPECNQKMLYFQKKFHKNYCEKVKIVCPQGCGKSIRRGEYPNHIKSCMNSDMPCPYSIIGCHDVFQRNQKKERLEKDAYKHLDLAIHSIFDLKEKITKMEKEIEELKNNNNNNINNKKEDQSKSTEKEKSKEYINQNDISSEMNNEENSMKFLEKKRLLSFDMKDDMMAPKVADFSLFNSDINGNIPVNNNNIIINKNDLVDKKILNDDHIYEIPNVYENHYFNINKDIIESHNLDGEKHYFIFFNKRYDIPKDSSKKYSFTIKILINCPWIAMGICDKKIIEMNNYQFDSPNHNKNIKSGMYYFTTNQCLYNCNNNKETRKFNYKSLCKNNINIICTFDPKKCHLEFVFNSEEYRELTDVKCFKSDSFSPFLIFLKNCKIQTIFNYN